MWKPNLKVFGWTVLTLTTGCLLWNLVRPELLGAILGILAMGILFYLGFYFKIGS